MVVVMHTTSGTYYFGSTRELNALLEQTTQPKLAPQFSAQSFDRNNDGLTDNMNVQFSVFVDPATIRSVVVVQAF